LCGFGQFTVLGHDFRRDQPDNEQNAKRYDNEIIQISHDRNKIWDQVDW